MDINFKAARDESDAIFAIVQRAENLGWKGNRMTTVMDLTACHLNGCPLDLQRMKTAPDYSVIHDVAGIARHIDRETGKLRDHFSPHCAAREDA